MPRVKKTIRLRVEEISRLQMLHLVGPGWWYKDKQCKAETSHGMCPNIKGHEGPHWTWTKRDWEKAARRPGHERFRSDT